MIIEKGPRFNSKILLFGEYTLMSGSMALSMPFPKFYGQLLFETNSQKEKSKHYSTAYLVDYIAYLKKNSFKDILDLEEFDFDINNGLYFDCNIPISYGLGSSGAIVASIYNAYSKDRVQSDLKLLKSTFSRMESYYHGKSSGLDPLVSYLNKPILILTNGEIETTELPAFQGNVFLVDTEFTGETQPLVTWYLQQYEQPDYRNSIQKLMIPKVNESIEKMMNGQISHHSDIIKSVSIYTYNNFTKMIPENIKDLWRNGLDTDDYYLKLCGSGGGGMMLGFTNNIDKVTHTFSSFKIHIL